MTTRTFVALDLETTGLDLDNDRITEVGAVRFAADGTVLDTFETLVNPGREIPPFVEQLTGVTNATVRHAPPLATVLPAIRSFIGESVVVGQNVGFDLAHLRKGGLDLPTLLAVDTAELSRLLLPARQPRGLMELAATLGVEAREHHRALPDAQMAREIYVALTQHAQRLDPAVRGQLARLISIHNLTLAEAIAGDDWGEVPVGERALPSVRPAPTVTALQKRDPIVPIPTGRVREVMGAGAKVIAGFEERPEQMEMAEAVRSAMGGSHLLVEAGTGVGKSLAYLAPAALHALTNGERVVISTNTINLQEQLFQKDIPALRKMLRAAGVIERDQDLRAAILKGRSNYLCLRRWTASYAANLGDPDFARLAAAMLLWLPETETGDRAELNFVHNDWLTWQRFSAQDSDCLQRPNAVVKEGKCFLQRARKGAESAHLLIVNHALLLADVASGGAVLPAYDHLIIDEAHNLEDQATQQFGGSATRRMVMDALDGLYRPRQREQREGGVATLLKAFPEGPVNTAGEALTQAVTIAASHCGVFFEALARFLPAGPGDDERLLLDRSLRAQPGWEKPEALWADLDRPLADVAVRARQAAEVVRAGALVEEPDVIAGEVETAARKLEDLRRLMERLMGLPGPETIVWLGAERDGTASLNSAPLDVGPTLWENLLSRKKTVVATSATLSAAGDMRYTARRLGFESPGTLKLGSPFDYERSTLLCAFDDLPEPSDRSYEDAVADAVLALARASEGRALALFTSHGALRRVAERVRTPLQESGINLLAQGIDGPPRQLTENLMAQPRSLVLGTSSFWEGVDVRGDALSLLIIARLPFAVPSDPIHRSRSEQYEDPFREYSVPSAILKFRQGFGRLIRDRTDRGVVAVLDSRIYSKKYGADFIAALPSCRMLKADVPSVARRVAEWLE